MLRPSKITSVLGVWRIKPFFAWVATIGRVDKQNIWSINTLIIFSFENYDYVICCCASSGISFQMNWTFFSIKFICAGVKLLSKSVETSFKKWTTGDCVSDSCRIEQKFVWFSGSESEDYIWILVIWVYNIFGFCNKL